MARLTTERSRLEGYDELQEPKQWNQHEQSRPTLRSAPLCRIVWVLFSLSRRAGRSAESLSNNSPATPTMSPRVVSAALRIAQTGLLSKVVSQGSHNLGISTQAAGGRPALHTRVRSLNVPGAAWAPGTFSGAFSFLPLMAAGITILRIFREHETPESGFPLLSRR